METSVNVGPTRIPRRARASDRNVDRSWRRCCCWSLYFFIADDVDDDVDVAVGVAVDTADPPRGMELKFVDDCLLLLLLRNVCFEALTLLVALLTLRKARTINFT